MKKPSVNTRCVASRYAASNERIIEFSSDNGGGLIAFTQGENSTVVSLYRLDPGISIAPAAPTPADPAPLTIWTLVIDTGNGTTVEAYHTKAELEAANAAYCRKNRGVIDGGINVEDMTDAEIIYTYWHHQSARGEEWHVINSHTL